MRCFLAAAVIAFASTAFAAQHPIDLILTCQQNTSDGRILISDGTLIPETIKRYKMKSYRPTGIMSPGWTTGTCVVSVTKGISD